MSNILVTGGSGFIGSHIIEALKSENHNIFNIDKVKSKFSSNYSNIDINDSKNLEIYIKANKIEYVYHIAAIANARRSLENVNETVLTNIGGTTSVLNACANSGVKKVILASTVWVYNAVDKKNGKKVDQTIYLDETCPIQPECGGHFYTTSKLVSEFLCQDFQKLKGLNFTILRYGIPYGPRMWEGLVLRAFTENALSGKPLTIIGDGSAKRRFVHISDLAKAHVLSLSEKADNQIYNLEGNEDITIKELAEIVANNINNVNIEFKEDSSRRGELSTDNIIISNKKIKNELGWTPLINIQDGAKDYINWYKDNTNN